MRSHVYRNRVNFQNLKNASFNDRGLKQAWTMLEWYFSVVNDTLTRCFGVKRCLNHKIYADLLTEVSVFHFRSSVLGKFTLGRSALVKKIIPWGNSRPRWKFKVWSSSFRKNMSNNRPPPPPFFCTRVFVEEASNFDTRADFEKKYILSWGRPKYADA